MLKLQSMFPTIVSLWLHHLVIIHYYFTFETHALSSLPSTTSTPTYHHDSISSSINKNAIEACIQRAKKEHETEFENGIKSFGISKEVSTDIATAASTSEKTTIWSDGDFSFYKVGEGSGGPTETLLKNGEIIYETLLPILTNDECNYFIETAKETIQKERSMFDQQQQQNSYLNNERKSWERTNSELGEVRLSNLPADALMKLQVLLKEKLYPMLISRFGVDSLTVYDGLILGNIAPSRSQPLHRDASLITVNIPLSSTNDFTNGGTYFEDLQNHSGLPLRIQQGKAVTHSSGIMHAGTGINSGERWVMVFFVISKDEPQIARRCHAQALDYIATEDMENAKAALSAGLNAAPKDHLLHMGIGQVAFMEGNENLAYDCLCKSASFYPPSHKAALTMGKMLLSKQKPRAALRKFESVLSIIDDNDLLENAFMPLKAQAWDARISAGRCAVLCAEYEAIKKTPKQGRKWAKERLPIAIHRLSTALIPVPDDEYIQSLISRAKELLQESHTV